MRADTPPVTVRVLNVRDKAVEVRPGIRAHYAGSDPLPPTLPYRTKAFFVFQRIDDYDVCFFGYAPRGLSAVVLLFMPGCGQSCRQCMVLLS